MVTVFLRGGLGNQMFQYAAGLAVAKKNNTDLVLDTVFLNDRFPRPHFTYRTFDLADVFDVAPRFTRLSTLADAVPIPGVWLGLDILAMKMRAAFHRAKIVYEGGKKEFDLAIIKAPRAVILYGRWEDENYFKEYEHDVRLAFQFRHALNGEAAALAERIASGNSVSLHVRRGDYAADKRVGNLMGDTNLSYYERAVEYMMKKVEKPTFFVFSDDIEWCKKNITIDAPVVYVPASCAGPKAAHHLQLMSLCKHNIIANSTFSWWGAWLNANPEKMVIAPRRWYSTGDVPPGLVSKGWIKL